MPLAQLAKHTRYDYSPLPTRPDFRWPGDKRLAVCICNNIEVFSFLSGLGSDSTSLTAPQTTRNYAWRDYGNRVGQWYVFDLLEHEGLCMGGSTGINVAGAIRLAKDMGPGHTIVTILADYGSRYQSKLFDPEFLRTKHLPVPEWLERRSNVKVPYQKV